MIILKKHFKKMIVFATALVCVLSMTLSVAAANKTINLNKKGTVFVSLFDPETNEPLNDGELSIYKVADLRNINGEYVFVPTAKFEAGQFDLTDISLPSLAEAISDYVFEMGTTPRRTVSINRGVATFGNLECGLYLIEQSEDTLDYYPINSFLVSLPMLIGDEYVYDINATPKVERATPWTPVVKPPEGPFDTDEPNTPPGDYPPNYQPPGDNPPGGVNPGNDTYYDEETPPDVILRDPDEANLVDFEKADITLKLFSADYSPAMKISLLVLGVIALILICILIFDKKSSEKKKTE